jgi:hypothetical protein
VHFWSNTGKSGHQSRFADNLLDVEVNVGDISATSFDSPSSGPTHLGKSKIFVEADSFIEEPTITQFVTLEAEENGDDEVFSQQEVQRQSIQPSSPVVTPTTPLELPPPPTTSDVSLNASETITPVGENPSSARQRRIKVNREVEKIVVSTQFLDRPHGFSLPVYRKKYGLL